MTAVYRILRFAQLAQVRYKVAMLKNIHHTLTVPESLEGERLDKTIATLLPEYSRAVLQKWIKTGQVKVDDKVVKPKEPVLPEQTIIIDATLEAHGPWTRESIALNVIYDDDDLLVVNKPPGMVSHPAAGNYEGTLVNAILHHYPDGEALPRAGLIHRLDKDTSGLLVIAKTLHAHKVLTEQMQARAITREYLALVNGAVTGGGTVDKAIGRHPRHRTKMSVVDEDTGKPAITHYRIFERYKSHTLLKIKLETGRTHQIRVHMAYIHHPIVGDPAYGGRNILPKNATKSCLESVQNFPRQALHAFSLKLSHPISEEALEFEAPLPDDFEQLLSKIDKD